MAIQLPPPPTNDATGSFAWLEWFRQLRVYISTAGSIPWNVLDFTGSALSDIASRSHQVLQAIQGGTTGEYYHLTSAQHTDLTDSGDSTLHYHASDRNSANFTGTSWTDLTDSGNTTLHTHTHNLLDSLQGGSVSGGAFELTAFESTAFEQGAGEYYHLTAGEYAGTTQSNIDAAKLLGNTWASPEAIGSTTPAAGTFTDLTSTGNTTLGDAVGDVTKISGNAVLPKDSGYGLKVDTSTPTFGWRDLLGPIDVKAIGATDPVWAVYRGNIYAYTFDTATAGAFLTFHVPHDYVPGSDMYIHMHWSQIVVDSGGGGGAPGNVEWNFDITYADGHGTAGGAADPFIAPITVTVVQQGSTTQYGHMIAEVQFTNNGGTGGLINSNTISVDGLILVRVYRTKANAADTLNQAPFVHTCDIHYQSTNMATKNKSPNFYS